MATRTEQLNTMYTTTWQLRRATITDQIMNATPLFMQMTKKGKVRDEEGGRYIEEPLRYELNPTVQFVGKGATVQLQATDPLMPSQWNWKYLTGHIVRYFTEFQQNRGRAALINKVNADIDNLRDATITKMEATLFADGTADGGLAADGLANIVKTAPATTSVGGIDPATNSWWRNQYYDMSSDDVSVYLLKRMRKVWDLCGYQGEGSTRFPDICITEPLVTEAYEEEAEELLHITDPKMAELGFGDLAFKGRPMVWCPSCPTGYMYLLNTNFLNIVRDNIKWLSLGEWLPIYDQPEDVVAHSMSVFNLTCSNRKRQGVIFGIAP